MSDMINKEDNSDVIGHGEETAKSLVKMENTLKEAATPRQREEVYTVEQQSNWCAGAGNFTMSTLVTMGGLGSSAGKSPS